jgi:hypothetical protein
MLLISSLFVLILIILQGHGGLNLIYGAVAEAAAQRGWYHIDIVIIGGDFQVCSLPIPSFRGGEKTSANSNRPFAMPTMRHASLFRTSFVRWETTTSTTVVSVLLPT